MQLYIFSTVMEILSGGFTTIELILLE